MKVVVLASRIPYPLEKGDKLRLFHLLKEIGAEHEIVLCCLDTGTLTEEQRQALEPMVSEIHLVRLSKIRRWFRMAWAWTSDLPFQVIWFTERRAQREVRALLERTSPDVVFCQLVRCAEYVKDIHHLPKVLDYMDALSAGMHRRAHSDSTGWLRPLRWLFRSEGTRLARYESRVFDYFDAHSIISRNDRLLIPHRDQNRIELVPNGVDLSSFSPAENDTCTEPVLLFTGNMSYAPNVDAAQHLVRDILPLIQHPGARIVLAGANPKPSIKALASDRVTVTGWVDDIAQEYRDAALFIAPLRIGTGLQNKVLEAMASELPCVLSPHAFAPLNLPGSGYAAVCHDAADFAAAIDQLLSSADLAKSMARAAREAIQTSFAWNTHGATLNNLLSGVVASPSDSVSRN